MLIPLPFPKCYNCYMNYNESYHKDCGGVLEIDPKTLEVYCKSNASHHWNIWTSQYHCSCGNVFEAKDVKYAVDEIIENCKLCAEELDLMQQAYWRRKEMSRVSQRNWAEKFFYSLGYISGGIIERLVDLVLSLFK